MTLDALWPGPDHTYPNVPRDADGFLDEVRMPIGPRWNKGRLIDPEPTVRTADGRLVRISEIVPARPTEDG